MVDPRVKIVADALTYSPVNLVDYNKEDYEYALELAEIAVDALDKSLDKRDNNAY